MKIKQLKLKNFRNYHFLELAFDEHINIFYGDNAQGKTNILEAVYLAGTTKSHRSTKDRDMIGFGSDEAHLELLVNKNDVDYLIDMHLKKNSPKGIAINKIPIRKARELFGIVNFVFFSPEDLNIIKNGPGERRRFIDFELSQLDRVYLSDLTSYNKVINQRNHLLKDLKYNESLIDTLDIWDEQLAEYGERIISARDKLLKCLGKIAGAIHYKLTGEKESLKIYYEPSNHKVPLKEVLKKNRERDIYHKSTTVGPHRDDICFEIEGIDARVYGSQGQQRTVALSLKLAEIELIKSYTNQNPILLLDDVLSELDEKRQNYLLDNIKNIQTLITCTGLDEFVNHRFAVNKVFMVDDGNVVKEN
ncbi:DNA replication and repair protein RecF [Lachnospiraceae bacterium PF1-21]